MVSFTTASVVEKRNVHLPASLASYRAASARFINSSKDASFVANAIPMLAPMLAVAPVDSGYGSARALMEHFRLGLPALRHVLDNDDGASVRHWVSSHLELASVAEFHVEGAAFLRQPGGTPLDKLASERFSKLRQPHMANELRERDIELQ